MMAENENGAVVGGAVTKDGEDWLLLYDLDLPRQASPSTSSAATLTP
jgi:hypothetical protein